MSTRPEFLRSAPYVVDPKTRIDQLKENLAEEEWQHQQKNILKLIEMYETGELRGLTGGIRTWLKDGEVLDHEPSIEEVTPGTAIWLETLHHQFVQLSRSQELASQMAQSTSNGFLAGTPMHEIFANFRLVPEWGGDPNLSIPVVIANDTGSDIQTTFDTDLILLNYDQSTYGGRLPAIALQTANGLVIRQRIQIQVQIIDSTGREMTRWFLESAVIVPHAGGTERLSGAAMRNHLYFATAPGNTRLWMSVKKHGLITQLPVV
ncbi:hypothetical protein V1505DRAFT_367059 [Lipomyces doorenjongii]